MATTAKERYEVLSRLEKAGISYEHANALRRISMTLRPEGTDISSVYNRGIAVY